MVTCHVGATIANHRDPKQTARIPKLLVDTGSEYTCTKGERRREKGETPDFAPIPSPLSWLPEATLEKIGVAREKKDLSFVMANGAVITRSVGFAIIHVEKYFTIDEVVFAEKGDLSLLGARTLEGLNLVVDSTRKRLVAADPIPAA